MRARALRTRTIAAAAALGLVLGAAGATPAHASAKEVTFYHYIKIYKMGLVPQKALYLDVDGERLYITHARAHFEPLTGLGMMNTHCNWRVDFLFYDTNGRRYKTFYGSLHEKCNAAGTGEIKNFLARPGRMCAKVIDNGRPVQNNGSNSDLRACVSIHRGRS